MLRELKTFLAVVRSGTFAAAGARIGLTQSAVSAQMQRLEEALGAPLFNRTGRSATLNDAGRDAVELAEEIVVLFGKMGARVSSGALRGLLRLGAIQSTQVNLLPDALKRLQQDHPQVAVKLVQGSSLYLVGQIDAGEIDAALMVEPPFSLPPELAWQPLLREPFVVAVPRSEPGSDWRTLLAERPFVRYDRASFGGRGVEQFLRQHGLRPSATIDVEDVDTMVRMVSRGLGISLVPVTRPRFAPADVRTIALGANTFHREIGMLMRREPERSGLVAALREALLHTARAMPGAHPALLTAPAG